MPGVRVIAHVPGIMSKSDLNGYRPSMPRWFMGVILLLGVSACSRSLAIEPQVPAALAGQVTDLRSTVTRDRCGGEDVVLDRWASDSSEVRGGPWRVLRRGRRGGVWGCRELARACVEVSLPTDGPGPVVPLEACGAACATLTCPSPMDAGALDCGRWRPAGP